MMAMHLNRAIANALKAIIERDWPVSGR